MLVACHKSWLSSRFCWCRYYADKAVANRSYVLLPVSLFIQLWHFWTFFVTLGINAPICFTCFLLNLLRNRHAMCGSPMIVNNAYIHTRTLLTYASTKHSRVTPNVVTPTYRATMQTPDTIFYSRSCLQPCLQNALRGDFRTEFEDFRGLLQNTMATYQPAGLSALRQPQGKGLESRRSRVLRARSPGWQVLATERLPRMPSAVFSSSANFLPVM